MNDKIDEFVNKQSSDMLATLLDSCSKGSRSGQKQLYQHFYNYAMSICLRYAPNKEEAQEIMNDGFLKVFKKLHTFDRSKPFRMWLRRIMINTAIDYYRRRKKNITSLDLVQASDKATEADALDDISAREILQLVQELPPSYRLIFNLYVIEGYKHEEIAEKLNIHVGTSKSNLAKARKHLKKKLYQLNQVHEK